MGLSGDVAYAQVMKALLLRHATAIPRGTPGILDDERLLTSSGVIKFRKAARGAPRPDVHEPMLGASLTRMLGSVQAERLTFKKGGAALVDLAEGPSAARRLICFLNPRTHRTIANLCGTSRSSPAPRGNGLQEKTS
jgi:phosphohistidine phosphatase SixA